jgi:hypothetical protein
MQAERARHGGMVCKLQTRADHTPMRLLLIAHLNGPRAIVRDNNQ